MPMVKQADGSWARTPFEIAERWRQHATSELGGVILEVFDHPSEESLADECPSHQGWCPPTLDEVIDFVRKYQRGKALGTDLIPVELLLAGGLPVATLLHKLIVSCWLQRRVPLLWKGGRLIYLDKPGGIKFTCEDKRGILINDQMATIFGRTLRPQLLSFAPKLVPLSQAIGPARRGSILAAQCSWALFSAARHQSISAAALFFCY